MSITLGRPSPPQMLLEPTGSQGFMATPDLAEWVLATFIADDAALLNEDHAHLRFADIGFLWTNAANTRKMRTIVGQCEEGQPRGSMGKWPKARAEQQLIGWFGNVPDFVITIYAPYAAIADDASFCALIEHELYHAAQELDDFGQPKFHKSGTPCFALKGHDIEEFVGVVRRYGPKAAGVEAMIEAAKGRPEVAAAAIAAACGTCLLKAA